MPKQRNKGNGEGSIYQLNKDKWRGLLTIGRDTNGKLIRKSFTGNSKKEVDTLMSDYKLKRDRGLLPSDEKITLEEWFYLWLFTYRVNDLKPSSFEKYEGIYRNYIKGSVIGKKKLRQLRTTHIQDYYNTLLASGITINDKHKDIAPSTIKNINKTLKAALTMALKQNYIPINYCSNIVLPKEEIIINDDEDKEISFLTLEEQKRFIKAISNHRLRGILLFALGTGLRMGELLALKWSDIKDNNVSVTKSLKEVAIYTDNNTKRSWKLLIQTPKTKASIRKVPIPNNITEELDHHRAKQNIEKLKAGRVYQDNNYIFCNELGLPLNSSNLRKCYKRLLNKADISHKTFHSLRHTYATRLFENNVSVKTVQQLLGHSSINTTMNIYIHVTNSFKEQEIDKINNSFVL